MFLAGDGSGIITADCGRRAVGSEAIHNALGWVGPETDIATYSVWYRVKWISWRSALSLPYCEG
jgi:hypothetical protein